MLKIIMFFLSLNAALPVFAKGSADKSSAKPGWVENSYKAYPETFYLTAVEYGQTRKEAESAALEALAAILSRSISSETKSSVSYSSTEKNGQTETDGSKSVNKNISISTNIEKLTGAEIKEVWQDMDGKYYALAVLNKEKSAVMYAEKISANNLTISELTENIAEEKNTLTEYTKHNAAYLKAAENAEYLFILSVLSPEKKAAAEKHCVKPQTLKIKCMSIAKKIPIGISLDEKENSRLKTAITKVFSEEGFSISSEKNARYILKADLKNNEEPVQGGKVLVRYTFETALTDKELNQVLLTYSASGREIHFNKTNAVNKILKTLEKKIKTDFLTSLKNYLNSLKN